MEEIKYYTLEELNIGDEVSYNSLRHIFDQVIILDLRGYEDRAGEEGGMGKILHIGSDFSLPKDMSWGDILVVKNRHARERRGDYLEG